MPLLISREPNVYAQTVDPVLQSRLSRLENFLVNQFNGTVGLVRESPDNSISRDYWLLSDNLIATHVLAQDHPDIARKIAETMHKFGIFTDGMHEALFGDTIPVPQVGNSHSILFPCMPLSLKDAEEVLNDNRYLMVFPDGNTLKIETTTKGDDLIEYRLTLKYDGKELRVERASELNTRSIPAAERDITDKWASGSSAIFIQKKIDELKKLLAIE